VFFFNIFAAKKSSYDPVSSSCPEVCTILVNEMGMMWWVGIYQVRDL
jgi:hypothetical protein